MSSRMSIIQSEIKVLIMGNTVFFIIYIMYNVLYIVKLYHLLEIVAEYYNL